MFKHGLGLTLTLPWEHVTSITGICRLRIILYYIIKICCGLWLWSFKPFGRYGVPNFCTSDLVATLTLTHRPSKPNQLVFRFSYIINQSLVKFVYWYVKYCANRMHAARTPARTHGPTSRKHYASDIYRWQRHKNRLIDVQVMRNAIIGQISDRTNTYLGNNYAHFFRSLIVL